MEEFINNSANDLSFQEVYEKTISRSRFRLRKNTNIKHQNLKSFFSLVANKSRGILPLTIL